MGLRLLALHTLSLNPGDSSAQEPNRAELLLIFQDLHVGKLCDGINGSVARFSAHAR